MSVTNTERGGRVTVVCPQCGIEFKAFPSRIINGRSKYCSRKCSSNAKRILYKGRKGIKRFGENNPNWKGIRITKYCPVCGNKFKGATKTCSIECGHKLQGKQIKKFQNGNWKGEAVFLMRNYIVLMGNKPKICKVCGGNRRIFVHHLDGDRRHNTTENLIYLCSYCHTIFHFIKSHPNLDTLNIRKLKELLVF